MNPSHQFQKIGLTTKLTEGGDCQNITLKLEAKRQQLIILLQIKNLICP